MVGPNKVSGLERVRPHKQRVTTPKKAKQTGLKRHGVCGEPARSQSTKHLLLPIMKSKTGNTPQEAAGFTEPTILVARYWQTRGHGLSSGKLTCQSYRLEEHQCKVRHCFNQGSLQDEMRERGQRDCNPSKRCLFFYM
ncbi:hypothetical protein MHYP_G00337280 [Metynnis hypsauchen]